MVLSCDVTDVAGSTHNMRTPYNHRQPQLVVSQTPQGAVSSAMNVEPRTRSQKVQQGSSYRVTKLDFAAAHRPRTELLKLATCLQKRCNRDIAQDTKCMYGDKMDIDIAT